MAILGAKKFKNYIDGEWADAASGATFESTSPANGETIGAFPKSGLEDVDHAVAAAKAAYEEWRLVPAPKRGEVLFRFAQLLAEHKDDAFGATRQVPDVGADARRGRRGDHALELSDRDPVLEDAAGDRLRQHGRLQACDRHARAG